jgi:hypothetical protein
MEGRILPHDVAEKSRTRAWQRRLKGDLSGHCLPPLRTRNRFPIGVRGPKAPNRHRPQVVASPEGVHGRDRFWSAELQAPRIHLGHHR